MDDLAIQFRREVIRNYEGAKNEIGYNAAYYRRMLNEHCAVGAAKHLVTAPFTAPEWLTRLWVEQRLDLSMENSVLRPKFSSLFTPKEIRAARQILKDHGYTGEWDRPGELID